MVYIYIVYASLRGYNIQLVLFVQLLGVVSLTTLIKPFRSLKLNYVDISCLSILSLQLTIIDYVHM